MGNDDSKTASSNTHEPTGIWYEYLAQLQTSQKSDIVPFYKSQIAHLQKIFRQLDKTNNKSLELSDLRHLPPLTQHPFKQRFITLFEQQLTKIKTKKISLEIFLHLLSTFHVNTELQQKAKFLFRAYDWDRDFKLNHSDLVLTLRMILRQKMVYQKLVSEDTVKQMASEALAKYGSRGEIRLEQFMELVAHDEIREVVTFRFSKSFE